MPADPPSNTGSPDRSRPAASELNKETTESDLWNLDEDPVEMTIKRPSAPPSAPKPPTEINPDDPSKKAVQRGKSPAPAPVERKAILNPQSSASPYDEIGELEEQDEEEEESDAVLLVLPDEEEEPAPTAPAVAKIPAETQAAPAEEAPRRENRPRSEPSAPAGTLTLPKPKPKELIGLAAVAFLLLLGAIWVLSRFFTQLSFQSPHAKTPDFPLKGEHSAVVSADTFWRAPIRDGPDAEKVKREAAMIPVVEVALDPASSQGALRFEFRNQTGEKIGDVITRGFQGGKFSANGNTKITVTATDGFPSDGDFNAYLTSETAPWTIEVREGSSIDGGSSSFKPLAVLPIKRSRR
ncbi:hypothetical protein [Haloferula sp. BvORR071]|uniref:hypothetical protein n=1 Tax=Haloferula sp. BvORR071 TaxID=1396141 RepID=UPI00054DE760|nr:hypothetical protein [Haloferula sp. BvORR071]